MEGMTEYGGVIMGIEILGKYFTILHITNDIDFYGVVIAQYYIHYDIIKELTQEKSFKGIRVVTSAVNFGRIQVDFLRCIR